jgi:Domain of Unknown Function (DUF1080)
MKLTKIGAMICGIGGIALTLIAQPPAGGGRGFLRGAAVPFDFADNEGWTSLFDGKTLNGWKGNPQLWSVKDGSLYIHPSCEHPTGTTYIYWTGGEVADFVLKYEMKGNQAVNGGMQFRSYLTADPNVVGRYPARTPPGPGAGPGRGAGRGGRGGGRGPACENPGTPPPHEEMAAFDMNGPQADFDAGNNFSAMFYEQGGRGIIALPGHALLAEKGRPVQDLGAIADKATLDSWFHRDEFNQFMIVAKGNTTSLYMNGHLVTVFIDNDPIYFRPSGMLGPEVESTGEYWVRNIYLKKL